MKNSFTLNGPRGRLLALGEPARRLIQELDICQFNTKATSMDKTVLIRGDVYGFRAPNKIFRAGSLKRNEHLYAGSDTASNIFDAALAFGLIGPAVRQEIATAVANHDAYAATRSAIQDLNIALNQIGVKLTPAQQKAVAAFEKRNGAVKDLLKGW